MYTYMETLSDVGAVVVDQIPLSFMSRWKSAFQKKYPTTPLYEVDAHNVVPVWEASSKQEFAAHTFRRKLHEKITLFVDDYSTLHKQAASLHHVPVDWQAIETNLVCRKDVSGVGSYMPGEQAAHAQLKDFFKHKLSSYEESRNAIDKDGQSNLSPYISHGNISRRRIVLDLCKYLKPHQHPSQTIREIISADHNGSNGARGSAASFVEESAIHVESVASTICSHRQNASHDSFRLLVLRIGRYLFASTNFIFDFFAYTIFLQDRVVLNDDVCHAIGEFVAIARCREWILKFLVYARHVWRITCGKQYCGDSDKREGRETHTEWGSN
jgi:hypothetical protein